MQEYLITDIIELHNKKHKIVINYEPAFALYTGELRKYNIVLNKCINQQDYEIITNELLPKRACVRSMNLLKSRNMTESELIGKLKDGFYPEESIAHAIAYVKKYGYIDDRRYVESYLYAHSNKKSKLQIKQALTRKGIDKGLLSIVFEEYYQNDENSEKELVKSLISKRKVNIIDINRMEKAKLFGYLTRKGFRYDTINSAINEIVNK